MADALEDVRVGSVVANEGTEVVELLRPWRAVVDAGGRPALVARQPDDLDAFCREITAAFAPAGVLV